MASFSREPKGRGYTSLCLLLHSVLPRLHCPASTHYPESSLSGSLHPTELRTKKEDCPTPSSKPSLWNIQGTLRLQKPSPAPPLPLPPIPLWCQSSLKPERLLFSLIDISLSQGQSDSAPPCPPVKEQSPSYPSSSSHPQLCLPPSPLSSPGPRLKDQV